MAIAKMDLTVGFVKELGITFGNGKTARVTWTPGDHSPERKVTLQYDGIERSVPSLYAIASVRDVLSGLDGIHSKYRNDFPEGVMKVVMGPMYQCIEAFADI